MSVARSFQPHFSGGGFRQVATDLFADEARVARLGRRLVLATVVLLVAFAAYYAYDRYHVTAVSPLDQAVTTLEGRVRQDPNNPDLRMQIASGYAEQGRYDLAIAQFQEVLKLREDWAPALEALAATEMERGDNAAAEQYYRKVADKFRDTQYRYASEDLQVVYYRLGVLAAKAGRHDEAASWAQEALQVDGSDADALYLLGTEQEAQGNAADARDAYRKAVSFDPRFRDGWAGLERAATTLGDTTLSAYARGMGQWASGDAAQAVATLQQLVNDAPDFAPAYEGLGLAYVKQGNADEAGRAFRAALDRDPDLALAKWTLGAMESGK